MKQSDTLIAKFLISFRGELPGGRFRGLHQQFIDERQQLVRSQKGRGSPGRDVLDATVKSVGGRVVVRSELQDECFVVLFAIHGRNVTEAF